jgi:hypothetical protein
MTFCGVSRQLISGKRCVISARACSIGSNLNDASTACASETLPRATHEQCSTMDPVRWALSRIPATAAASPNLASVFTSSGLGCAADRGITGTYCGVASPLTPEGRRQLDTPTIASVSSTPTAFNLKLCRGTIGEAYFASQPEQTQIAVPELHRTIVDQALGGAINCRRPD